jgi:transposase
MSRGEIDRLAVIRLVVNKQLKQREAAAQLSLSTRQVKRLVKRYRSDGAAGLVSGHRGKRPGNAIDPQVRSQAVALIREHYSDFTPRFAYEKLSQIHGLTASSETVRQWMIAEGIWPPKRRKTARIHQRRPRRPCRGELVQIDGSPHDWFEGRGPRCTLIVFIDDATSALLALRFVPSETTQAYMETLQGYLLEHGRPVALYSDKHSIFRVNHPDREGELTQFTRALKTLEIEPIHANTPQAKGRVERVNQTLQDRLVKELRLRGIDNIDEGNAYLPEYLPAHNQRFAVEPANPVDAHRAVLHADAELKMIFTQHHHRKLSKNLTLQFRNREYQVQTRGQGYTLRGATVTVCEPFDGPVVLLRNGKVLEWRILAEGESPIPLDDEKSVDARVDHAKAKAPRKPAPDHPWHRMAQAAAIRASS